jgi:predicted DNA-binding transcriptional regulator AlpA
MNDYEIDLEDIYEALKLLNKTMRETMRINSMNSRLWSIEDVALYAGVTTSSMKEVLADSKDFPKGISLFEGHVVWHSIEVKAWFESSVDRISDISPCLD